MVGREQVETLIWQFEMIMALAQYHLPHLTDSLCLWKPSPNSWTVHPGADGKWRADWQVPEPDPMPTPNIAWISWQIIWWWSGTLAAVRGSVPLAHDQVFWPGSADEVRTILESLSRDWSAFLSNLSDKDLEKPLAYPWPDPQPLSRTLAWVNSELMKNIAEIGYVRHMHLNQQCDLC
jgi:hypothetical protein